MRRQGTGPRRVIAAALAVILLPGMTACEATGTQRDAGGSAREKAAPRTKTVSATPTPTDAPRRDERGGRAGRDRGMPVPDSGSAVDTTRLAAQLQQALDEQRFGEGIVDLTLDRRTAMPNVDVAVIELDASGRPSAVANAVMSADHPHGAVVPIGENLGTTKVRWRRWDINAWEAGRAGTEDVVRGREDAPLEFMSPYPASVVKLMVGFGVLRAVDRGQLSLDDRLSYTGTPENCAARGEKLTRDVRDWFDRMITVSDNAATCVLLARLHDLETVEPLNATFRRVGLTTLQVRGTDPETGGWWLDMNMSALDTARLLLVLSGAPGTLWRTREGAAVTADLLSPSSRAFFTRTLGQQGLNHALSTSNWCGREYPASGIPQRVPERWIRRTDGTVTVDGRAYRQDVRPCNRRAEVTFAHKTGLSMEAAADVGIVRSLPGAPERHYIVAVFTNLGQRFTDADKPADPPGTYPVAYTEKIAKLGHRIDTIMIERHASH
ncbi:serine hydrolase [Actinopolymorpha sp. B9G3]|uniref:serine hydrolase n=1 Tax=Actinopolymorpha sp. B9G3 TaxID=3158970 RepID=UPI0032D988A1